MTKPTNPTPSADYKNLVDLLAVFSEAKLRLATLENNAQAEYTEIVDEHRAEYAELQSTITECTVAIEALAVAHPEWFAEKRSVKTPYGTVKCTRTTTLDIANPEATALLIERAGADAQEKYLRTIQELNIEALENLTDAELKAFRIVRVPNEAVKIAEARIDFGKAVKAAERKEEVAA